MNSHGKRKAASARARALLAALLSVLTVTGLVGALSPAALAASPTGTGGFTAGVWQPNLEGINQALAGRYQPFEGTVVLMGGSGRGGIRPGVVTGGFGGGGSLETLSVAGGDAGDPAVPTTARLDLGLGGFTLEYGLPLGRASFFAGAVLGGGGVELSVIHRRDTAGWGDAVGNPQETVLEGGFALVGPYIGMDIPLAGFVGLRVFGSYFHTIPIGKWTNFQSELPDGPKLELGGPALMVSLAFGLF